MTQGVSSQWLLDLAVGGETLNANPTTLPEFQIIQNIHQHLPSIKFTYQDASGSTMNLASIADGTPITIGSLGLPEDFYTGLKFVALGMPKMQALANSVAVTVSGVLNNPGYLRSVVDKFYEGNSSDVLSQMVSEIGLIPDVDITNDLMTWLPIQKTVASMARHISAHGWASAASCMLTAVTDGGVFRYKNLENIISGGSQKTFSSFGDGIQILDWSADPKTAFANAVSGYGATSVRNMPDGTLQELKDVSVTLLSQFLPMATDIMDTLSDFGARINFLPLDTGNVHEKWLDAKHQNTRIASTFAFDVNVLIDQPSHVNLLDLVSFSPVDPVTGQPATNIVGDYIVTAINKSIKGQRYYEKLTFTSNGTNTANFSARG